MKKGKVFYNTFLRTGMFNKKEMCSVWFEVCGSGGSGSDCAALNTKDGLNPIRR